MDAVGMEASKIAENYEKSELELMTTFQLREICRREKIMNGVLHPLDKEELIRTIMRYKGKRQDFLIREYRKAGKERLEEYLKKSRIVIKPGEELYCQSQILAYEGLSMEYYDGYTIPYRKELAGTNALLIGSDLTLCTVLNLKEHGGEQEKLYITKAAEIEVQETERKDYRIFCVGRQMSECLYHLYYGEQTILPEHIEVYSIPLIDFAVRKPVTLMLPMAIDFGSVNTAAGVYLDSAYFESIGQQAAVEKCRENEINYTLFEDGEKESMFLPSVIGVLAVEKEDYKLMFGYDAIRLANASWVDEGFCVFYDVKRWIEDYDEEEEIADRQGRRRRVKRSELLRRFFLYIIRKTENRFKCRISQVHISSLVKQKQYFCRMLREILPEYMINQEMMLDEGMAVLYNTISNMLEQDALDENEQYKALIIDCGGSTADLCSCRFHIRDRRAAYKIYMETTFENGDVDFGGNNLTYRIMQLLKIALVRAEGNQNVSSVEEILEYMDTDIYRFIDVHGVKEYYRHLDEEYQKAEAVLPTRFADFERHNRSEYYKVKNNFYTLFDAAEQMKKLFYGNAGALKVMVTTKQPAQGETAVLLDKWKLSFRRGDSLNIKKEIPEVAMSCFEIERILSGEIYGIVLKFMEEFYQSGRIQDFSFIKLTGQSCRIPLFKEALKEFLPGRMIQFRKKVGTDVELKMAGVDGALKYLHDRKYGLADIHLNTGKAVLPYRITAYTHNGKETVLVDGLGDWEQAGTVSRNMEDLILPLYLKTTDGEERCRFRYMCRQEEFSPKSYEEIEQIYGSHILQKETDSIEDGDVKFFVWAEQEEWGFQVVPVSCGNDELYLGKAEFFRFENDNWVNSFFDGKK
ncbi:MAG: molecular chaperone [Lachnospiraceae bacterium]|nr:molecular chaperone [Lachnospiraceae bacterium]